MALKDLTFYGPATVGCACVVAALTLSGCGLSTLTSGFSNSIFGGGKKKTESSVTSEQLLRQAKSGNANTGSINNSVSFGCPKVSISTRDHQLTVYLPGQEGNGLAVMHRGEITRTARECHTSGGQVTVKYGVSGRILLGPKGRSGPITLPIKLSVSDTNRIEVQATNFKIQANVSLDNPIGYFSQVATLSFKVPPGARPGEFQLSVGFVRPGAG